MNINATALNIRPAMQDHPWPEWVGAMWIGEVWVDAVDRVERKMSALCPPVRCRLQGGEGYRHARILVRTHQGPLGFIELDVHDGDVDFSWLTSRIGALRGGASSPTSPTSGTTEQERSEHDVPVSVALCTRNRVDMLRSALESILALDYPSFEVIVVDNAPDTETTRKYVLGLADPRVRLIEEPLPGLSRARNAALLAAANEIVAFTDDDVVVDRYWLRALVDGFSRGTSVSCVSGIVPAGEIRTPAQAYFDRRVGWSDSTEPRVFEWSNAPADVPLFPFAVRYYGTGANFAVKRDVVRRLGGFDEALGAGSPSGGGEDIDMFIRILRSRGQLVHDPAAIVWHRHRADGQGLLTQTRSYDVGLGAWLSKIAVDPEVAARAIKTAACNGRAFLRHLKTTSGKSRPSDELAALLPQQLHSPTWRSVLRGLRAYRSALREGRRPHPLLEALPQGAES